MKILVIGETCKDIYSYGSCDRICPDAPVPVFVEKYRHTNAGMAGNVLSNLRALGVSAEILSNSTRIIKHRFVEERTNHMIVRIDSGDNITERLSITADIENMIKSCDAIVISDYDKGFLHKEDIEKICSLHETTILDTKKILGDFVSMARFIKLNDSEYKKQPQEIKDIFNDKIIHTLGSDGCIYKNTQHKVDKVEVRDTTGAGDTFIAALTFEYVRTKDIYRSMKFANLCATEVVTKRGVVPVSPDILRKNLE